MRPLVHGKRPSIPSCEPKEKGRQQRFEDDVSRGHASV